MFIKQDPTSVDDNIHRRELVDFEETLQTVSQISFGREKIATLQS